MPQWPAQPAQLCCTPLPPRLRRQSTRESASAHCVVSAPPICSYSCSSSRRGALTISGRGGLPAAAMPQWSAQTPLLCCTPLPPRGAGLEVNDVNHRKLARALTARSTSEAVGPEPRQRPSSDLRRSPAPANGRPSRASRLLASEYTPRGDILALQPVHRCQDVARIRRWSAAEASILYV